MCIRDRFQSPAILAAAYLFSLLKGIVDKTVMDFSWGSPPDTANSSSALSVELPPMTAGLPFSCPNWEDVYKRQADGVDDPNIVADPDLAIFAHIA